LLPFFVLLPSFVFCPFLVFLPFDTPPLPSPLFPSRPSLTHCPSSHDLHRYYLRLHSMSRDYKKQVKERNAKMAAKGRSDRMVVPQDVEMDNFQDPQISSSRPLVRIFFV